MATVKLEVNAPVTGTVTKCWFQKSTKADWSDQIKLTGNWDGKGEGNIYVHVNLESDLQKKGIVGARNGDFFPLIGSPRIQLLKKEEGGKKFVDVTLLSGGGGASSGASQGASSGGGHQQQRSVGDPKLHWQKVQLTMASCLKTARQLMKNEYGAENVTDVAIQVMANTLFEERARLGLYSSPPPALADQAMKDQIGQGAIKLGQDEAWLKAELLKVGCTDIAKLTVPEAAKVVEAINSAIAAKEAAAQAAPQQGSLPYEDGNIPF